MTGENKFLKIVFFILIIAVIGEVVYLFSMPRDNIDTSQTLPNQTPTQPVSGPNNTDLPPAFNFNTLDALSRMPFYPNTKALIYLESKNKVVDIRTEKIMIESDEFPIGIKFQYQPEFERWVHFSTKDVEKMKIFYDESGGGIKKPANFTDIKKGDTIFLKSTLNPYYPTIDPRYLIEIELDIIR